jgi:hypothetical protein
LSFKVFELIGFHSGTASPQNGVTDQRNHHLSTLAQELLELGDQAPRKPWFPTTSPPVTH